MSVIRVAEASDIVSMPLRKTGFPDSMEVVGQVQLTFGWYPAFEHVLGSAELREKSAKVNGDTVYDVEVRVELNDSDTLDLFSMNRRYICYVEDRAGVGRLVGTKEDPLVVDTDYGTGAKPGSGNKSAYVLRGRLRLRPPYYQL